MQSASIVQMQIPGSSHICVATQNICPAGHTQFPFTQNCPSMHDTGFPNSHCPLTQLSVPLHKLLSMHWLFCVHAGQLTAVWHICVATQNICPAGHTQFPFTQNCPSMHDTNL